MSSGGRQWRAGEEVEVCGAADHHGDYRASYSTAKIKKVAVGEVLVEYNEVRLGGPQAQLLCAAGAGAAEPARLRARASAAWPAARAAPRKEGLWRRADPPPLAWARGLAPGVDALERAHLLAHGARACAI